MDGGYAAPGLQTLTDTENYGGTFQMPMTERLSLRAKSDHRGADLGLTASAHELNVAYELNDHWGVATGVRMDERRDDSPVVPLTQEQGERTDAVVQVGYDSKRRWSAYGFVQDTVSIDGDREENGRVGTGGSYRIAERVKIDAEVSNGDLGAGGKVGTNYLHNDRTTLYLNYALENERTDNGLLAHARQRRQHRRRRQDAAVGQHERVSRGALSEQRASRRVSRTRRASAWRPRSGSISVRAPTSARCATR